MVDFSEKTIGSESRSPTLEDWVCHFEDTIVDLCIVWTQPWHKILLTYQHLSHFWTLCLAYIYQCVPALVKIWIRNYADSFSELSLNVGWGRDHQADESLLDRHDFILRQLITPILVLVSNQRLFAVFLWEWYNVVIPNEVFEVKSAWQTAGREGGIECDYLEE